ncbi:multiple organellar RNA editing factor 3, mitochondrial-like [Gossypium arboreum]|uniref:multiple organellar RNA editing factor 3, mitochondrial-like n=1 Tax=Gossypium arboreum TaxID=29729 RepID=UPI0022F1B2EB|nr:multiple organellar RNA editing factor 3, mitochondrial-like [Gossypium arboreum]XP_052880323.1 multiple organellar RNA editing factor 3, mitochondrial-like [Gossypium arboreum]
MAALSNTHFAVGRDDDLWVIPFQFPEDQEPSLGEEIDLYVKTLASVVGSEEEAKKRIYAVSSATSWYTGFRAFISKKMAHELGGIRDSENEYPNEDVHGGNLLVDGKVVFRPTFSRMQQPEFGRLLVLLNFVLDQILTDIYICKLEETETDNGGETNVRRARIFFDS